MSIGTVNCGTKFRRGWNNMTKWVSVNGTDYAYSVLGKGEPLILLHGFTGRKETWESLATYLENSFQMIVIDLPGHGQTKTKSTVTMEQFVDDLFELTRKLHINAFHLLGYSLGGRSALSYVMKYPHTVLSLVLESASPGLKTKIERDARIIQDEKLVTILQKEGIEQFVSHWENISLFTSQKQLPEAVQQQVRHERLSQSTEGLVQSLRGMGTGAQPSWWDKLPDCKIPILLIAGALDEKFVNINREMNRLLKNSKLHIMTDVGHAVHLEQVEKFAKIVKEYLFQI